MAGDSGQVASPSLKPSPPPAPPVPMSVELAPRPSPLLCRLQTTLLSLVRERRKFPEGKNATQHLSQGLRPGDGKSQT